MEIYDSPRKMKRFVAVFADGTTTHFGSKNSKTYIDHGDDVKRANYIARHRVRENWNDYKSPGALSRYITWGDSSDILKNIREYKRRFNLAHI
jgi:hypothetical protein